jgi:signal transduction histidine kinase
MPYRRRVTTSDPAGWLSKPRPRWAGSRTDVIIALVVAAIQMAGTTAAAAHHPGHPTIGVAGYTLLAIGPLALLARRRYPITVLAVTFGVTLLYWDLGYPRGPVFFALIVAFFTVVRAGQRLVALISLLVGYFSFLFLGSAFGVDRAPTLVAAAGLAAWLLVLFGVAEMARARQERAIATAHSRAEEARRQASEERVRIARELHDVLAHNISLINVQAGTALHLMDNQPERARSALSAIKDVSKETLVELRAVLGLLRQVDEDVPRAPAPSVSHLDDVVARSAAAGLTVRVDVEGARQRLPASVDLAAYRIVQEALTNVARHAGAASATVHVTYGQRDLIVEVTDDGRGNTATSSDGGNGIPGMRERAAALGGTLQAGSNLDGGFRVRAWLPVDDER